MSAKPRRMTAAKANKVAEVFSSYAAAYDVLIWAKDNGTYTGDPAQDAFQYAVCYSSLALTFLEVEEKLSK